jgi:carboxymethylenebutenolidase
MVSFPSNGDIADAYLATPESGRGPGVIVIQEWWGLVAHIEDVTDRFAREGFVALAPDFYHGAKTSEPDEAARMLMSMAMDRAARDIGGAAAYLRGRENVVAPKGIAAVGFCMGGSLALWSATLSDDITTTVGFYPAIPWSRMSPTWDRYQDKAAVIHCSEEDGTSAAEGMQAAKKAIEANGGWVELYDYEHTSHAFFNDQRPEVHDPEASAQAWTRTLEFLRSRLA